MPEDLRRRLSESAQSAGTSLNAEIVRRLDESLTGARNQSRGEWSMSRRRFRLAAGVAMALLVVAAVAVAGRVGVSGGGHAAINKLSSEYTIGRGNEGIGEISEMDGPAEQAAFERAYPAAAIPLDATQHAQQAWHQHELHPHSAGGWQLIGPSKAVYPSVLTPF